MMRFATVFAFAFLIVLVQSGYVELEGHGLQGGYEGIQIGQGGHEEHSIDYHAEPKYAFNYAVHDPHTGDEKQHVEERDGDVVKGSYSVKEADGTTRVVEYHADKHNGFNAKVTKIGEPVQDIEHYGHGAEQHEHYTY